MVDVQSTESGRVETESPNDRVGGEQEKGSATLVDETIAPPLDASRHRNAVEPLPAADSQNIEEHRKGGTVLLALDEGRVSSESLERLEAWSNDQRLVRLDHAEEGHWTEGAIMMVSQNSVFVNDAKTWYTGEDGHKKLAAIGPQSGVFALTGRFDIETFASVTTVDADPKVSPSEMEIPDDQQGYMTETPSPEVPAEIEVVHGQLQALASGHEAAVLEHRDGTGHSIAKINSVGTDSVWVSGRRTYEQEDGRDRLVGIGPVSGVTDVAERLDIRDYRSARAVE
jgi:hypothetical protein